MGAESINNTNYFELRPVKIAKVSEISEATAASSVPPEERMNFHIGNPVQDQRLYSSYFKLVSGVQSALLHGSNDKFTDNLQDTDWNEDELGILNFIENTIKESSPYLPRGGYNRKKPRPLIAHIKKWLSTGQVEPLSYDFGETSPRRECMLATGGVWESLRILFHALSTYLIHGPAKIFLYQIELPDHLKDFRRLSFAILDKNEEITFNQISKELNEGKDHPVFLVIGPVISETLRRNLRQLSLQHPLFFVEMNQAENHQSIAREAKMQNRVLRILHAGVMAENLAQVSVEFIIGNPDFIKILETVQFELKGTPSATETALLNYLLNNPAKRYNSEDQYNSGMQEHFSPDPLPARGRFDKRLAEASTTLDTLIEKIEQTSHLTDKSIKTIEKYGSGILEKIQSNPHSHSESIGSMAEMGSAEIIRQFFKNINNKEWLEELAVNFLNSFHKQHPEYTSNKLLAVSGSARTALSLLGFHCGFNEVLTADLGWTYEHCFPRVTTVPLTADLNLDDRGIREAVEKKLRQHPGWRKYSAVILNNPHNASGHIVEKEGLRNLLLWLLEHKIYVIDDLSYQNVLPSPSISGPKTLRQIANQLVQDGYLTHDRLKYLITVHSLSKTDCFAGARLAVVEINDTEIFTRFEALLKHITPNLMAFLLAYLFYRNEVNAVNGYWFLRNKIFSERMKALEQALKDLPEARNPFSLKLICPQGSMYPRLIIEKLPNGLSLDWLSSRLATSGIGLIPLSTFARTACGFEIARKSFRLTLGGSDTATVLAGKTRRLLITLNRLVAHEQARYNFQIIKKSSGRHIPHLRLPNLTNQWELFSNTVISECQNQITKILNNFTLNDEKKESHRFFAEYLPFRLSVLYEHLKERVEEAEETLEFTRSKKRTDLISILEQEFHKVNLENRSYRFRKRLFDRTVHPTQMYALKVDMVFRTLIQEYFQRGLISTISARLISKVLTEEYFGLNIPITSSDEADELVYDLRSIISAEKYIYRNSTDCISPLLSFWGDWDGSNRPSGQGHRLVAAALLENVTLMANLIMHLKAKDTSIIIDSALQKEINLLPLNKQKFWRLLNKITQLTNQLEKRYRGFIPLELSNGKIKKTTMRLHMAKDPFTALWQHNDRLEKKMFSMRVQRRTSLEFYFSLNKRLRKTLHNLLPTTEKLLSQSDISLAFGYYRDLLSRFVLTPRIHQRILTSDDPFTIDTTVHNIMEINEISGKYGNPGMVMALQVSMSTEPEVLIILDRKLRARREEILRENPDSNIPSIWLIPLFEDVQSIENLEEYLDKIWAYANQSRKIDQSRKERFSEMICEIFIAGSDLSQQIGQAAAASLYGQAKTTTMQWLAARGLVENVRMKFGSGEAMQRQGGFYDLDSEHPLFVTSKENSKRMQRHLKDSTQKSTEFAKSPLRGVLVSGDLRTFQSAISEKLRFLSVAERANLFHHISKTQQYHDSELARISEPLLETRLQFKNRGFQDMASFIRGNTDSVYDDFLKTYTDNFRQILYGDEEDIVGIHVISHFISRSLPELRDRPTVRPSRNMGKARGQQIIERVAQTLPLCKHGSMLRAIGHNRAQTMVLGINQLTTGLFRALNEFASQQTSSADNLTLISNRILPHLPVREILQTLFFFHDPKLLYIHEMERAFPAGNSSFLYIQEDFDSISPFIGLFQKEYLRRFGLDISDFFNGNVFNPDLLPVVQPEFAILLQKDIFNTDPDIFLADIKGNIDEQWKRAIQRQLQIPILIKEWREKIWAFIKKPIYDQVESFVELAKAIHTISNVSRQSQQVTSTDISEVIRLGSHVARLLKSTGDDSMRQFLTDVVQLLTQIPSTMTEIPVDIIRALRDVERIVKIEEQILSKKEQDLVRFYLLQIARLTGDNA